MSQGVSGNVEREGVPDSVASYVAEAERRLSEISRQQFRRMTIATLLPLGLLLLVLILMVRTSRAPAHTELLQALSSSNEQLAAMTEVLLQSSVQTNIPPEVTDAIIRQSALHEQVVTELNQALQEPTPESQSLIQVVGSAAILALLGALGIQRLQNIDTEINNVRTSVFEQAETRAKAIQEGVQSQVSTQVQRQFSAARAQQEQFAENAAKIRTELQNESSTLLTQIREEVDSLEKEMSGIRVLLDQYPWLKSESEHKQATAIQYLVSVEQAQSLAETFRRADDHLSAAQALRTITKERLPGSCSDFHNAFSEAMRLNDPSLALSIVDLGLDLYPDQYDLVADKTNVLARLGRADEAKELFEDWRSRKPSELARSWRPVVFYEDLFASLELTEDAVQSLVSAFEEVTAKLPFQIKPWAEYADLMMKQGEFEKAQEILTRGLEYNPYSQQLNYVLGELLLKRGQVAQATPYLEKALKVDYQDQYQHDVSQHAVRATLAQAYEAADKYDEAKKLYQSIVADIPRVFPSLFEYASNRIAAITLLQSTANQAEEPSPAEMIQFLQMVQALASEKDNNASSSALSEN